MMRDIRKFRQFLEAQLHGEVCEACVICRHLTFVMPPTCEFIGIAQTGTDWICFRIRIELDGILFVRAKAKEQSIARCAGTDRHRAVAITQAAKAMTHERGTVSQIVADSGDPELILLIDGKTKRWALNRFEAGSRVSDLADNLRDLVQGALGERKTLPEVGGYALVCDTWELVQVVEKCETEYVVVHDDERRRVPADQLIAAERPEFGTGDRVAIVAHPGREGVVVRRSWHFNKREFYYLLAVDGKRRKRRYFADELELLPDAS
jgi:hypothetical protein